MDPNGPDWHRPGSPACHKAGLWGRPRRLIHPHNGLLQTWECSCGARFRHGTWRQQPSLCMAGVALADIDLRFAWQACMVLGDINVRFARQLWHLVTSRFASPDNVALGDIHAANEPISLSLSNTLVLRTFTYLSDVQLARTQLSHPRHPTTFSDTIFHTHLSHM